jgi:hypothetical protein
MAATMDAGLEQEIQKERERARQIEMENLRLK